MEESRKYETAKYVVNLAGFVLNAGLLIYLLKSGWSVRLRDVAERTAVHAPAWSVPAVVVLIYFAVIGVLFTAIQIPLDFFSGYYLEHHFRLSRQSPGSWVWDQIKGL